MHTARYTTLKYSKFGLLVDGESSEQKNEAQ